MGYNMFAYCGNCPVLVSDFTGEKATNLLQCADISMQSHRKDAEIEFRYYCKDNGIHLYSTIEEAVETWAIENRPLSQQSERMSYIYYAYGSYFYTDVYEGTSAGLLQANVIVPTIALQASRFFDTKYMVAAQVHSHPEPGHGFHNDFPSYNLDVRGGDRIATILCGYPEMFIIPYLPCPGTPGVIRVSDPETWCSDHPYWFIP